MKKEKTISVIPSDEVKPSLCVKDIIIKFNNDIVKKSKIGLDLVGFLKIK